MCCPNQSLPLRQENHKSSSIAGWHKYIAEYKDKAMFWHVIWKQCGCPAHGVGANIRRTSRAKYHQAIRHTRKQNDMAKANKLATSMLNKRSRDFWTEVAKIRGSNHKLPGSVDGIQSEPNISEHFARKYEHLYNSVSYVHFT